MKSYKNFYTIFFIAMIISSTFCTLGGISLYNDKSSLNSQELQIIPINPTQFDLSDGMYVDHTNTWSMGGSGAGNFNFTQNSNSSFHIRWNSLVFGLNEWDVNTQNRAMANITGAGIFTAGNHDPSWIFTNVSLGMTIPIAVISDGDQNFNISGELTVPMPGAGLIDVWILDDLNNPGTTVWYEKTTGVLINGTFQTSLLGWYSFDFLGSNIAFTPNDYAPELTGGLVTPLTGNQTTQFNFSVTYTDRDNNTPFYVNVLVNGTPNLMETQNPSDVNYTDGCTFQYLTVLQPGLYNYSFECYDGIYSNSTFTYTGINVTAVVNLNTPVLSDGQVTPGVGYNSSTIYFFRVNYSDIDNNPPSYVNVTINSTTSSMNKEFPSDENFVDGCWYIFNTTLPTPGSYTYYFNCSDVNYTANLGTIIGPVVQKTQLFNGMYVNHTITSNILASGPSAFSYSYFGNGIYNVTWVNYGRTWDVNVRDRIIYNVLGGWINSGSHTPAWIHNLASLGDTVQIGVFSPLIEADHTLNISAEIDYLLPGFGPLEIWVLEDLTSPGGIAWYEKSTGILLNGTFNVFGGIGEYTFYFNNTNADFTYIPCDYAPELTAGTVVPLKGNQTTLFNFSVIYTDQDNNYPLYINTLINGTPYPMEKQNTSDVNYTDGCLYQTVTYLQPGFYNYSFECGDWNFTNTTVTYFGVNVSGTINLNAPTLGNGQVLPPVGYNSSTIFIYRVNYSDVENNPPIYVNITINQTNYAMNKEDPLDTDYINGCWYTFNTTLPNLGTYNYSFDCSDINYTASHGPFSGPLVKKTQVFHGLYINHTYTSSLIGNGQSSFIYSHLSGSIFNAFQLGPGNTWDEDIKDRKMSNIGGAGWYDDGSHSPAWINNTVSLGTLVPIAAILENDHIFNVSGETTLYHPIYGWLDVWILEDLTTPGESVWYEKTTGILLNGTFISSGGLLDITYYFDETNAEFPNAYAPKLTSGSVVPLNGNQSTLFNFTVLYTDQDGNPPLSVNLSVNGTRYPMTQQNPADRNYTDGCWFEYLTYLQPGTYNYSFECGDWKYTNSTITYTGINVTFINYFAPNLTDGLVYPPIGWSNSTPFLFTVNYTDSDNNAPTFMNVTINGTSYDMVPQNPLDSNFVDGCIYQYSTPLDVGTYNYTFNCSDGLNFATDGPYFNLTVKQNVLNNYIMVPDYRFEWVDATIGIRANLATQDDEAQLFNLPFPFQFYNESFSSIYVCTNGFASFTYQTASANQPFPTATYPYMIAPFWSNLMAANPCNIFVRNLTSPNRVVIEWQNIEYWIGILLGTFEIVLFETGEIVFNYISLSNLFFGYSCGLNFGIDTNFFNAFNALNDTMSNFSILFYQTDAIPPTGSQSSSTNSSTIQTGNIIWVNGTASDNIRIQNVFVQSTNHTGTPWSANQGSGANWSFNNISTINDGCWEVVVNVTDLSNNSALIYCYIFVDNTPPTGLQWANTSTPLVQQGNTIWINGTANDINGSGIQSINIIFSNSSGGISDWSTNVGSSQDWTFYNTSYLADNQFNGCYEIIINITDVAGNEFNLTCKVTVENGLPYGSQSASTNISSPQRPDVNGRVWVNGTALDDGFGVRNVTIQWSNHSSWSSNQGSLDTWAFYNSTPIGEGLWEIWVNITDYANQSVLLICQVFVDTVAPSGAQWLNTTSPFIQKISPIWINGTASDINGSGIQSLSILSSNSSGGVNDWSANMGSLQAFAFYNVSTIVDNSLADCYEIVLNITDNAGNQYNLTCRVTVEVNPPYGTQDAATQIPTKGDVNGRVWVNGTSFDLGFGMKNVTIQWSNHSGWSSNQGTLNSWAFYNTTSVGIGLWEVQINVTDLANNSAIIICYIFVDYVAPTGSQDVSTDINSPQNGAPSGYIYVNGTATDGLGIGIQNVTIAWTNSSASWSGNLGTNESWSFRNTSAISDGIWELNITIFDQIGNARNISCLIFVDTVIPNGTQDINTQIYQTTDAFGRIWVNGTASDINGSGLFTVWIQGSNHTGAVWSTNQNTNSSWSFYNLTDLSDGIWEVYVNISDLAGNSINLTSYISVDTSPPSGNQYIATLQPQNASNGYIWINGSASDGSGVGLLSIIIGLTNHSGSPWSANLGTNSSWVFNNVSAINDGTWWIIIILSDKLGNLRFLMAYVTVDATAPQGIQDNSTKLPQTVDINGWIWINGTASDGNGSGILTVTVISSNTTGGISDWSGNLGTTTNWAFNNLSTILDGIWIITINVIDFLSNSRNITCLILVDNTAPIALQDPNTNASTYQESAQIWVNGTANDGTGFGILLISVVIGQGNAPNNWSANIGTNSSWAFTNTSAIPVDLTYWIIINIIDLAGNQISLNCTFRVELHPPLGTQDPVSKIPQNAAGGFIWINGTASDGGSGVKNISITYTNNSATFTNNLGDNSTWLFRNSSSIADGVWEVTITIFDNAGHSRNISGIIIVDTLVPSQPTNFIGLHTTGYQVSLSWSTSIDNTTVTYLIYRNSNYLTNTTFLNFTDIVPSAGTYIYYVVPVDAAGNMGPQSTNQTVVISGEPSPSDDLLLIIILIGVGLAAVAVVAIATRRRKRTTRPQVRPRAREAVEHPRMPKETVDKKEVTTKDEGKALLEAALKEKSRETPKKVDLNFFLIEGEKDLETPDVTLEVEDAQTPRAQPATTEVKEEVTKPKIVHFTFYCSSCRKWYGLKEFAQVDCPICNEPLKLSYFCPTCEKRYTVKEPKVYNCPRCKTTKLVP